MGKLIITPINNDIFFSSVLEAIYFKVPTEYIDIAIYDSNRNLIHSERSYPYFGEYILTHVYFFLEDDMRMKASSFETYTIEAATPDGARDSATFDIVYCDHLVHPVFDMQKFLKENFLTALTNKRVAPNSVETLYFFADRGESIAITQCTTFRQISTGDLNSITSSNVPYSLTDPSIVPFSIDIAAKVQTVSKATGIPMSDIEIVSVQVNIGHRTATLYVDNALSAEYTFTYRNSYNILETITFASVVTEKTEVERASAIIGNTTQFYDHNVTKSYVTETQPLAIEEANAFVQMIMARDVAYNSLPILITDCNCEVQNGSEHLNTLKFTWRYADNRPLLDTPNPQSTFSEQFNPSFS